MGTFNNNYYPQEIATVLYNLAADFDIKDFEEQQEQELQEITDCLYQLLAIAQNKYNNEFYRTFWNCLERITSIYE